MPRELQPAAAASRRRPSGNVVDGAAEAVLDLLQLGQRGLDPQHAAVRCRCPVQRRLRRGLTIDHTTSPMPSAASRSDSGGRGGVRDHRAALRGEAERQLDEALDALGDQLGVRGLRLRAPVVAGSAGVGARASMSNITVVRSTPETPSTSEWWTFEMTAKRPSSSPSTSQISHSGFERSRRWEKMRADQLAQLVLGAGRRQRGMAYVVPRLKEGSSIHIGRPISSAGGRASAGSAAPGAAASRRGPRSPRARAAALRTRARRRCACASRPREPETTRRPRSGDPCASACRPCSSPFGRVSRRRAYLGDTRHASPERGTATFHCACVDARDGSVPHWHAMCPLARPVQRCS